jgi:hypothetical protein
MSRLLEIHLGSNYSAVRDWTSVLRTKAGFPPLEPEGEPTSSFTIADTSSHFAKFLSKHGYHEPIRISSGHVTYHLEVVTTEGTLEDSEFYIRGDQIAKVSPLGLTAFRLLSKRLTCHFHSCSNRDVGSEAHAQLAQSEFKGTFCPGSRLGYPSGP